MPITQKSRTKELKMKKKFLERVPRAEVVSLTPTELSNAFDVVSRDWHAHLKDNGIKLPAEQTAKWHQLAALKHFQGKAVHKDDISMLISKHTEKPASDQQVRHLKTQGGWYVLNRGDSHVDNGTEIHNPDGCHALITTASPHPNATLGRRSAVEKGDWDYILEQYDYRCASCGTKLGEYHRFDSSFKVDALEHGHMDPNQPLVPGNIIPQCRWCNRTARGDFVFDSQGRPRAVANIRPVSRADPKVIAKIKTWIQDK